MPEKPSYLTSTTSQILIVTVGGYVLSAAILAIIGGIKGNVNIVAAAQSSLENLLTIILPLYAVRAGIKVGKNGNGGTNGTHSAQPEAPAHPTPSG